MAFSVLKKMKDALVTSFLFTQSDMKTIFFPVMLFAAASSSYSAGLFSIARTSFWVYLHLLQFCISNQLIGEAEDLLNKPWRPIVAGRISRSRATFLRWALAVTCLFLSYLFGVVRPGVMLAIGIWMNNELGFDAHWLTRNIATALGYYSFESGACTIISGTVDTHEVLGDLITEALLRGALIVLTTIHAQDFQDVPGDRIQGRKTLPIVAPAASRMSMILLLLMWSMWLGAISTALSRVFLISAAIVVGGRFMLFRTVSADRLSYILYNVWLSSAQIQLFHRA